MKDFAGNKILIGDTVVFIDNGSLQKATVQYIERQRDMVHVVWRDIFGTYDRTLSNTAMVTAGKPESRR